MAGHDRTLQRILDGDSDSNLRFAELRRLLLRLGFDERVRGGHHIFTRQGIPEILNLQPKGHEAKPYQVKQVRRLLEKYRLHGVDDAR